MPSADNGTTTARTRWPGACPVDVSLDRMSDVSDPEGWLLRSAASRATGDLGPCRVCLGFDPAAPRLRVPIDFGELIPIDIDIVGRAVPMRRGRGRASG